MAVVEGVVVGGLVMRRTAMKSGMVLAIALIMICVGCNGAKESTVVAAAPVSPAPSVPTLNTPKDNGIVASGPLVVENQIDVVALREGVVVSIIAQPGTAVRRGQLLARMDDRQISADLEAAAARVRALQANLQNWQAETRVLLADRSRAEKLYAAQVIPKEQLEHAVYKEEADEWEIKRETESLNNAKSVQQSLALEKDKTNIFAPFDGVVARRYVRAGQKVAVGDRLFWVTALSPLEVKFTLPERYFGKLHEGEQVYLDSEDVGGAGKFAAKIVQVSPVIDPSSGTMEVLARVTGNTSALRPGMLVNIALDPHQ
jgi:membrane fusion protein, multidrug efflux system